MRSIASGVGSSALGGAVDVARPGADEALGEGGVGADDGEGLHGVALRSRRMNREEAVGIDEVQRALVFDLARNERGQFGLGARRNRDGSEMRLFARDADGGGGNRRAERFDGAFEADRNGGRLEDHTTGDRAMRKRKDGGLDDRRLSAPDVCENESNFPIMQFDSEAVRVVSSHGGVLFTRYWAWGCSGAE